MAEIVLLKKAAEDIKNSRDWYDGKEENLGKLFVEKVHECILRIALNPKAHPQKYRFLRAGLIALKRVFWYRIFQFSTAFNRKFSYKMTLDGMTSAGSNCIND